MKKGLLFLTAAAMISSAATAQIRFAPEVGANFSTLKRTDNSTIEYKTKSTVGLNIGLNIEIPITEKFSFVPGVFYNGKGGDYTANYIVTNPTQTIKYNQDWKLPLGYVSVPLYFNYHLKPIGDGGLFFHLGPQLNFLALAKYDATTSTTVSTPGQIDNISSVNSKGNLKVGGDKTDDIKPFDFTVGLGLGYELTNGLFFRGQYNIGVSNIAPDNGVSANKMHTGAFTISAGYWFGGKK